jgi:hypothetical protein
MIILMLMMKLEGDWIKDTVGCVCHRRNRSEEDLGMLNYKLMMVLINWADA